MITIEDDTETIRPEQIDAQPEEPVQEEAEEDSYDPADYFYAEEISDELFEKMQGNSYPQDCEVSRDDLCHLCLLQALVVL